MLLQIPFAALLGDPEGAHQRINFVQVFSRIGYAVTPLAATALIYNSFGEIRYHFPYMIIAISLVAIAAIMLFSKLPSMNPGEEDKFTLKGIEKKHYLTGICFTGFLPCSFIWVPNHALPAFLFPT
jgi:fucose permease